MIEKTGNIWRFHDYDWWVVVTTNIGWRQNGHAVMGAGIAKYAATLYPELLEWYGARCQKYLEQTAVCLYPPGRLILFPTKKLNKQSPWLSWQHKSSVDLIEKSTKQLKKLGEVLKERQTLSKGIALPLVGCKNGKLDKEVVLPILRKHLDDSFTLVLESQ